MSIAFARKAAVPFATPLRRREKNARPVSIRRRDLTFILRNIATLLENGVSLPKALATVAREKSMQKYGPVLETVRRGVESGESFSRALARFPDTFGELMVNQIRVGERTGTLSDTISRITEQMEKANALRSHVVKKLAYPIVLTAMGSVVVTCMLLFVVPVFEQTYADAKIPLPLVTQALIGAGRVVAAYWWIVLLSATLLVLGVRRLRTNAGFALAMDRRLLSVPVFGPWLRDMAVLQLMDVLGNLMEAGFKLAEALGASAGSVGNRAVRQSVQDLEGAVLRGERFSRELERHGDLFPPVVSQLVIVGEQTGKLTKAAAHIRDHLRREIEQTTNALVGVIEPVLTISLAGVIAVILLAIYLPMFDMVGTVAK